MTDGSGGTPARTPRGKFMSRWRHVAVIDREIRAGNHPNAPQLAGLLELSKRTIKRHIEFMRYDLGAPIEYSHSRNGYYYRESDWKLPLVRVCEGELFAMVIGERALRGMENHPLAEKLQRVFQKIALRLPEEVELDPATLATGVSFSPPAGPAPDPEVFRKLTEAARNCTRVEIDYYKLSADERVCRTVDPYMLRSFGGEWYLAAYSHETGYVSLFHASRIRELEKTGDSFDREAADFDPDEYFGPRLGPGHGEESTQVRVRFTGWAARYAAERRWHPDQVLEKEPGGSVTVSFPAGWLGEVASWVLSFGEMAEVLEPPELRNRVRDRLERAVAHYEE